MKTRFLALLAFLAAASGLHAQTLLQLLQLKPCMPPANALLVVNGKWACVQLEGVTISTATNPPTVTIAPVTPPAPVHVVGEVTQIQAAQATLAIANAPIAGTLAVYLNGERFSAPGDYTVSGSTITWSWYTPGPGDTVSLDYDYTHN